MAEFLVKAIDATHRDLDKNIRGCYKRGDIVLAKPDGFLWGKQEGLPKFWIVKVPGLALRDAHGYAVSKTTRIGEVDRVDIRRLWFLDHTILPAPLFSALMTLGIITLTAIEVSVFVKSKV